MEVLLIVFGLISIVGGGVAGIYGLKHEFKDKAGRLTKHGKIALRGIIFATVVSLLSLLINLRLDYVNEQAAHLAYENEIAMRDSTIKHLQSIESNTTRLQHPLTDFTCEIYYVIDDTCASIGPIHARMISLIDLINRNEDLPEGYFHRIDSAGLRSIGIANLSEVDIDLDILPVGIIGLFTPGKNPLVFYASKDAKTDSVNDLRFRIPTAEYLRNSAGVELSYMVREHKYHVTISFNPRIDYSNGKLTSVFDLKAEKIGIALIGRYMQEKWPIEKILFKSKLGFEVPFYGTSFSSTGKSYPYYTRCSN
jgi:hypothetical protein